MRQYFQAKQAHPGVLVAMRVGDFFEFYGEDAELAAACLQITLTGREDGNNGRISMAGVPFHSVEKYLKRLLQAGHRVALCDQLEDPKKAKGLVQRGVTRVLSPGTLLEDSMLQEGSNNFLAAICLQPGRAGLATLDPSTGEFLVTELEGERLAERLLQEIARLQPAELLVPSGEAEWAELAKDSLGVAISSESAPNDSRAKRALLDHFHVSDLAGFGVDDKPSAVAAASMVLDYARKSGLTLSHVDSLSSYSLESFLHIDPSSRRSLELTQNRADGAKSTTLFAVLDKTRTPMGCRMLRRWIEQPLLDLGDIVRRQEAVDRLVRHALTRGDLRDALRKCADLERLVSRCAAGLAGPRDLRALRDSLLYLPEVDDGLRKVALGRLQEVRSLMGDHQELGLLLRAALVEDPPPLVREGGFIRPGYDLELDRLRELGRNGKSYIAALETSERKATGIDKLKVGYNSVFGYYLEIPRSQIEKAPDHYIRKQTTAAAERYITAELKEHESAVLGAEEKAVAVEAELFERLRARVAEQSPGLLQTARAIAELDVLSSLAEVAVANAYVRPELVEDDVFEVRGGRHAVVEAFGGSFVPNDVELGETRMIVLTGPNMSGKSTFLRQSALIAVMAQMGGFVPAVSARLGLCDRLFTRIGAKDELALGQSTFLVEMLESANILNNATSRSLVILDEVGRGTSTYDGLAIAWAMVEYLAQVGAKTLFATHYHQLNALADQIPQIANFRVSVEEDGERLVWTHRVLPGGTDRSYGVHVARMAGVPGEVLERASEVLAELEKRQSAPEAVRALPRNVQLTLFELEDPAWAKELGTLDVNQMTPLQALEKLEELKKKYGK